MSDQLPRVFGQLRNIAVVLAVSGGLGACVAWWTDPTEFYRGWVFGYMFTLSFPLGMVGLLMLHHLTGGAWGFVIQRILEAGARTVWVMPLLFVPLAVGAPELYHWLHPEAAHDHLLQHKSPYLNQPFWLGRAALYFAAWIGLAWSLTHPSKRLEETADGGWVHWLVKISGPGMVLYFLTMTFAAFDWAMSLEPHWFSTIYGLIFVEAQALSAMALTLVVLNFARRQTQLGEVATVERIHDLGKIQFALVALWAYLNFSQFVIIWYANVPEEAVWYAHRTQGGYQHLAFLLVFGQFALPFLLLLTRQTKRHMVTLTSIAGLLLVMRLVDLYWQLMPTENHLELKLHFAHVAAPLGLFGLWAVVFLWQLGRRSLRVERDPRWMEKLAHEQAH